MMRSVLRKIFFVAGAAVVAGALVRPFIVEPDFVEELPAPVPETPPKPVVIEKPLHNVALPDFATILDVKQKKAAFFNFIRPAVESNNAKILANRLALEDMLATVSLGEPLMPGQEQQLATLVGKYRVSAKISQMQQLHQLLVKVDEIPTPLVLVQAANESAWGTSRFARIGLNFFGIWCYKPGCGMVPRSRNSGAKHEVEAFQSVDTAVYRYLHNINTNNAYSVFRSIRQQLREQEQPLVPEVLAMGLLPYSERGSDYVLEISDMLRHNSQYLKSSTAP
ncbi:glucosaminidase domain-containing protein [Thalassotalea euphylliae]|nr:glucosaminidase domain-containing protein [Thalassotalea euphylliae]